MRAGVGAGTWWRIDSPKLLAVTGAVSAMYVAFDLANPGARTAYPMVALVFIPCLVLYWVWGLIWFVEELRRSGSRPASRHGPLGRILLTVTWALLGAAALLVALHQFDVVRGDHPFREALAACLTLAAVVTGSYFSLIGPDRRNAGSHPRLAGAGYGLLVLSWAAWFWVVG